MTAFQRVQLAYLTSARLMLEIAILGAVLLLLAASAASAQ